MNTAFYSDPVERNIVEEIMQWSSKALQKPNSFFNQLPPCPYARKAWSDDKVAIIFKKEDSYQTLWSCISKFDDAFDLAIVVDMKNHKEPDAFHDYLDSLPEIGKVLSVASGIKVAEELNDGEALSELDLALVKNMLPEDIKDTLLNSYISKDENQVRISARVLESTGGLNRNELLKDISNTLENEFGFKEDEYRLTGLAVLYNNMLQSLFSSQISTLGIVFGVISLMFLILFRSFALTAIGMVPNLLAAGVVLGSMGWMRIPLDIMTITVAAISVGMAVDNTIHYIHRFKIEFKKTGNYQKAMLNSHTTIGRAMFYTSLTIVLGFMVFVTSNFNPSVYFGFFVSLAMIMALLGALTLLPQLLLTFKPLGKERIN